MTDHSPASSDEATHAVADPQHPGDVTDEPHGPGDHGEERGHDEHADGDAPLGPLDFEAWGALAGGIALGLAVAACIALATGALG